MANESDLSDAGSVVEGRTYDACYYERYAGRPYQRSAEWLTFFTSIANRIAADIRPVRVLDAGCALGLLVETLRAKGIDAFGIDFSAFAIDHVYEPFKTFCQQASVTEPLREQYDLIVCFEVLEHLTAADGDTAIANFCAHSRDILFSSSPVHFGEPTHLNTQPPEYWATRFARHDFYRDVDFDASFVAPWAVRFRHRTDPPHRIVADYERMFSKVVIERNDLRVLALGEQEVLSRTTQARDVAQAARDAAMKELIETRAHLAHARETVENMQRSWFWLARRPWQWLSGR